MGFFCLFVCLFFLFTTAPVAYGSSWARGQIGASAEACAIATATVMLDLSCICDLCHSLRQSWILNPLSEATDQTHILVDTMLGSLPAEPPWELFFVFCFFFNGCICRLHCYGNAGSFNLLSQARDRTCTSAGTQVTAVRF